jgi:hypothetical protein
LRFGLTEPKKDDGFCSWLLLRVIRTNLLFEFFSALRKTRGGKLNVFEFQKLQNFLISPQLSFFYPPCKLSTFNRGTKVQQLNVFDNNASDETLPLVTFFQKLFFAKKMYPFVASSSAAAIIVPHGGKIRNCRNTLYILK